MNKIYKVIWSKAKHTYVVASEIAKGHTKGETTGKGLKRLAAALLVAAALMGPNFAWAEEAVTIKVEPASGESAAVEVYTKYGADKAISTNATNISTNATNINTNTTNINGLTTRVNALESSKTDTALHISSSGDLIVGTKENQTVKDMEIRGKLTSGSISTGDITSTGDVTVTGKMAADGVTDETTKDGTYIKQNNTVGNNLVSLDKQVKANADAVSKLDTRITNVKEYVLSETNKNYVSKTDAAVQDGAIVKAANTIGENVTNLDAALAKETAARIGADKAQDAVIQQVNQNAANGIATLATAYNNEVASREAADNELNERITNEANAIHETKNKLQDDLNTETTAREAADTALDTRITNVKEYLENQTSENYVSKTDAAVQDGAIVKADKTIGENVTNLDAALAKETAARLGADKAQDKVIQQVNQNMVDGFNTINKNMADGFKALNQADANELAGRMAADTKLVEAVNSGLSLSNDNVLQKNTTTIDAQGNVSTSKTDAKEMILNKGNKNQITLNEKGVKVGTNSSVMDADGIYTGGDTFDAAKAAMSSDGQIKGANGKFTVDASGNTTVTSLDAGTGTIQTKGDIYAKDATFSGDITAKDATLSGDLSAKDGTFSGDLSAKDGTFSGDVSAKDVTATGTLQGAEVTDGTATMKNGNITGVKNLSAETITTSGNADIGGDLTVKGKLNVDEIDLTKNGIDGDYNVTSSTKVAAGEITSYKKTSSTKDLSEKESSFDYDENSTSTSVKATDADGNWKKSTLTVEGSDVTSKVIDSDKNSNTSTQTASESNSTITGTADGKNYKSYITQNLKNILQGIKEGTNESIVDQTETGIKSTATDGKNTASTNLSNNGFNTYATDGTNTTYTKQTAADIKNTAENGTISNTAKDLVNNASENMTNTVGKNLETTVGGEMKTTVTGKVTEDFKSDLTTTIGGNKSEEVKGTSTETVTGKKTENYNGGLETTVTGEEKHTVNGSQTNSITGDQVNTIGGKQTTTVTGDVTEDYKANLSTTVGGSQTTTVTGDSSLTAENITNEAKNKITNKAIDVETDAASSIVNKVSNDYGSNTSTQLSYETKEEMSQADGKTASYLRGAAEEKSQLIDGDKKTTIDTVAGQTNTNITDGTNTSNDLQKADQIASSVTDGTNTTVVNQNAGSLASSITDGTKANNTNSTVDKSEQLIKASDTQYSATSKTATKMEDALVSGSSVIDVIKNLDAAANPLIGSAVTDGTNSTGVTQTAKDITNTAEKGTIANNAKDITNHATENMTNTVGNDLTTTVGGKMKTTVTGDVTEDYKANLSTTVGGNQTTTVTGDSSLKAENITNEAKNKITNKALDVETDAASSIVSKVSNDAGSNTSTQLSYQTTEEMSQADGKTASYLRGAAEEKSQLIDGSKKTTIDTIAGQTNTNITDGTNTSNDLQKADQIASSVTDGTNTTVVNQDAGSLASSITDGTKVNNTNNTVNKSEQLIKADDTHFYAETRTAEKAEEALKSGNTLIDIVKDTKTATVSSAVTDGATITGISQNAKDISLSAAGGTITNDAKTLLNKASESITDKVGDNVERTMTTKKISESVKDGTKSNTFTKTYDKDINVVTDGTNTSTESQLADSVNTSLKNGTQSLNNTKTVTEDVTKVTDKNTGAFSSSSQKADSITSTVKDTEKGTISERSQTVFQVQDKVGTTTVTTTDGLTKLTNEAGTHKTQMDFAEVLKDLGVRGNATVDGTSTLKGDVTMESNASVGKNLTVKGDTTMEGNASVGKDLTVAGKSTLTGDVTMKSNATVENDLTVKGTTTTDKLVVNNGATVTGGTTTDTLKVTGSSEFDGAATFNDIVTMSKGLSVTGGVTADTVTAGTVTADSYKVGDKTYIDKDGINANNQVIRDVGQGNISEGSTDAVSGGQLYETNTRVSGLETRMGTVETRVDKLDNKIDKVGANAAAMANLHPLEFDEDSKWNVAAAVGSSGSETASAVGVFYRPNENVMVNASAAMGTGENMFGGGVSLRLGHGGNKAKEAQMKAAAAENKELRAKVDDLTARMDALLSVLNPNMSKDFPDVPENHWAYEAVSRLAGNGIVEGYEDGKYHGERQMTRYEMAEIIYNALSKGAKAEKKLVEEFRPELQAMAAQKKA